MSEKTEMALQHRQSAPVLKAGRYHIRHIAGCWKGTSTIASCAQVGLLSHSVVVLALFYPLVDAGMSYLDHPARLVEVLPRNQLATLAPVSTVLSLMMKANNQKVDDEHFPAEEKKKRNERVVKRGSRSKWVDSTVPQKSEAHFGTVRHQKPD